MKPEIDRAIHAANPWLRDPSRQDEFIMSYLPKTWIPRHAEKKDWLVPGRAALVVGPRQAGKSSLLWRVLLGEKTPFLLLNCEDPVVRGWCRSPSLLLEDLHSYLSPGGTLFFEEIQHLEEAGLLVKGIVGSPAEYRLLVAGSSSYHLRSRTRESLAGRASRLTLFPLSLSEISSAWQERVPAVLASLRREAVERQLVLGSFPGVWQADSPETELTHLLDAFVMRDASDLYGIERPEEFRRLLELIAAQIGSLVNVSEWASIVGMSHGAVSRYLGTLEESHIIRLVRAFAGGRRREIKARPKAFFIDNGLRNAVAGGFKPFSRRLDGGPLFENWVFSEIHKTLPPLGPVRLHYWRSAAKAEVDFVLSSAKALSAFEVKATALRGPALSRSSQSFLNAYTPDLFTVVNSGWSGEETRGSVRIRWVLPEGLPEEMVRHQEIHES